MQVYTSRPIALKQDIDTLFGIIQNPAKLAELKEKYADKLGKDIKVEFGEEQITANIPMVGDVVLQRSEVLPPNRVKYETVKSPVPLALVLSLAKQDENNTLGQISLEVNIPPFLSGMIKGKIEPGLEQVSNLLEKIDFGRLFKGTSLEK